MSGGHGLLGAADAVAFLGRLTRLDPAAPVRLRPVPGPAGGGPRVALWGRLPWRTLVTRTVAGRCERDTTVGAAELLTALTGGGDGGAGGPDGDGGALPPRQDTAWRWTLPPYAGRVVETIPAEELVRVDTVAAGTLRSVAERRRIGDRAIRDALLDHVAIVVTDVDVGRVDVPQRLVQAVLRMGFLGSSASPAGKSARVCIAGKWTGLIAPYGTAWLHQVSDMEVMSLHVHTNG